MGGLREARVGQGQQCRIRSKPSGVRAETRPWGLVGHLGVVLGSGLAVAPESAPRHLLRGQDPCSSGTRTTQSQALSSIRGGWLLRGGLRALQEEEEGLETQTPPPPSLSDTPPTVYCCCCLANVSLPGIGGTIPESKPFFYVNVADIESLEVEVSYVACEHAATPAPRPLPPCPYPEDSLPAPQGPFCSGTSGSWLLVSPVGWAGALGDSLGVPTS